MTLLFCIRTVHVLPLLRDCIVQCVTQLAYLAKNVYHMWDFGNCIRLDHMNAN